MREREREEIFLNFILIVKFIRLLKIVFLIEYMIICDKFWDFGNFCRLVIMFLVIELFCNSIFIFWMMVFVIIKKYYGFFWF